MKKRILALLFAGILVFGLVGCGEKEEKETTKDDTATEDVATDTTATDAKDDTATDATDATDDTATDVVEDEAAFTVALVTDTGGIDDKSFNQGTWEGIQRFNAETGSEIAFAQSASDADYIPNLTTFAEDEYGLIVAPGFLFEDSITEVSTNFEDINFLIIDMVVGDRPNVASAVFAEEQGSYLVGVAAAQATLDAGKDKVGFIGGMDFGLIQKFEAGFEAGVHAVAPDMIVLSEYVGDFVDTSKGGSLASKMYDDGAYVVYHAAGGAGNGLIKEAKDRRIGGQDVWAIGVDKDQYSEGVYEDGKSAILTSMMKRVDVAAYTVANMALNGEFPGGEILAFTLANNGVGIPDENPNLSPEIVALVGDYAGKIISGEILVPVLPIRLQ